MDFFDPNLHSSTLFEMGGLGHLAVVLIMFGLLGLMILFRKNLGPLRQSRAFMAGTAGFVLGIELLADLFKFTYPCEPAYERVPLHLCAMLKLLIAGMILIERYDVVKFVSVWAIASGFISFVNLNLSGGSFENYAFWHYLAGHYYLFLMPLFLFLTGDFRYELGPHIRSMGGLAAWSLLIFFVNWGFDANYMYTGPHNQTVVPFIPAPLMVWPFNYFSYVGVGLVLFTAIYAILRFFQDRMLTNPATAAVSVPLRA